MISRSAIASFVIPVGQFEDLVLAIAQIFEPPGHGSWARSEKAADLGQERRPGRLVGEEDVVRRVQQNQPCVRDQGTERPALVGGYGPVVPCMDDERGARHLPGEVDHVDGPTRFVQLHRRVR